MTTPSDAVAVIATKLPSIDRRALSQAWFSALHLAQPDGAPHNAAGRSTVTTPMPPIASATSSVPAASPRGTASPADAAATRAPRTSTPSGTIERRIPAAELSRRIERAVVRHCASAQPAATATLAIRTTDGRVHVLLRSDGSMTRIIALCPPHLQPAVDRALAHARATLAGGGMRVAAESA